MARHFYRGDSAPKRALITTDLFSKASLTRLAEADVQIAVHFGPFPDFASDFQSVF
jgi:hypothetical protein